MARNADSHVRRAAAAGRGEMVDQYPGGLAGRAEAIDVGAGRTAQELIADVRDTAAAMEVAWQQVPDSAWQARSRDVGGQERALVDLPSCCWQELEVHLSDLGVGPTHEDWPDEFVAVWLPRLRASLPDRLPSDAHAPEPDSLSGRDELAWLYGRLQPPGLPTLKPWG